MPKGWTRMTQAAGAMILAAAASVGAAARVAERPIRGGIAYLPGTEAGMSSGRGAQRRRQKWGPCYEAPGPKTKAALDGLKKGDFAKPDKMSRQRYRWLVRKMCKLNKDHAHEIRKAVARQAVR